MRKQRASTEAKSASSFINQAIRTPDYKTKPGSRYTARLSIRPEGSGIGWFEQDVNMLFKTGKFLFTIPIQGETDEYNVLIEIDDFLPMLEKALQKEPFNVPTFQKTLISAMSTQRMKLSCQCPDFLYRWNHALTINDDDAGRPQPIPSPITNPTNHEGTCKHIIFTLTNKVWAARIARNLFNYVFDLWKKNRPLFDRTVRPALNLTDEKIENRPIKPRYPNRQPQIREEEIDIVQTSADSVTEAVNSYYQGRNTYDDDQNFMLDVARDAGADISLFVTPENTPEQMSELMEAWQSGVDHKLMHELSDPNLPASSISIIARAALKKVDLLPYRNFAPDVLTQLLRASKYSVPLEAVALKGFNARQIEQLVSAYSKSKRLFEELKKEKLNYQQMRDKIKNWENKK